MAKSTELTNEFISKQMLPPYVEIPAVFIVTDDLR